MDVAPRHSLLLQTHLGQPIADAETNALRAAVDHTTVELTVFLTLKKKADAADAGGWSLMQRRLAELYAVAMGQALRNRSRLSVDIVPMDFCAYSADDMAAFKENVTLVADAKSEDALVCPAWWPSEMRSARLATDMPTSVHCAPSSLLTSRCAIPWTTYPHVAVGGTFDHLHVGHKILLTATALAATNRVVCGISSDALLEKKRYKEFLEPYRRRELNVLLFLRKIRKDIIVELAPISDPYGPTATDPTIEALVVSRETLPGSDALNVRRAETGLAPMHLLSVDLITLSENADHQDSAQSDSNSSGHSAAASSDNSLLKISSTAIRAELARQQTHQGR
ncbi:hypothetical protein LPJ56_000674 [Coemansia sp. RSA 2599]|nr:hypothetical protein LPJ56_000674 [Coemansia sp. RSA 2599]